MSRATRSVAAAALAAAALLCALAPATATMSDVLTVSGAGTTNPSKFIWKLMDLFEEEARIPIRMTYRAVGSSTGMAEFKGVDGTTPLNDFGAGDIPIKQSIWSDIKGAGGESLQVPFVVGAISIFHSIPGVPDGKRGLNMTGCLLSKIFQRNITTWDDDEILAINPELKALSPGVASQNIRVVHRVKGSSSTSGTTTYLEKSCPDTWVLGAGSTVDWPADTEGAQGSGGVSAYIAANEYAIGYLDSGHGRSEGFAEVELKNKEGVYLSSAEADIGAAATQALLAGVLPMTGTTPNPTADWSSVDLYDMPGATTWPITMFSYFYLRKDMSASGQAGQLVKAFVQHCLSEEGQEMITEFGFSKVPQEVLDYNSYTLTNELVVSGTPFEEEKVTATRAMDGAGDYVLSRKRRSYGEYERSKLEARIAALEAEVEFHHAEEEVHEAMHEHSHESSVDSKDVDAALALGATSLVVSVLALGVAVAAYCKKPEAAPMLGGNTAKPAAQV